jgi:hypothetical protein
LADVELENPEFKSQNPQKIKKNLKNLEKHRKIPGKIRKNWNKSGKIQKKFEKNWGKSRKNSKNPEKVQKNWVNAEISKFVEDLATLAIPPQHFRKVGFYKLPPQSVAFSRHP